MSSYRVRAGIASSDLQADCSTVCRCISQSIGNSAAVPTVSVCLREGIAGRTSATLLRVSCRRRSSNWRSSER